MSKLVVGTSVKKTIISMALPMLAGTFAINAYNLTDTWFVSRLGTKPLAAMAFTFPVVMFLRSISHGVGIGAMTILSHALGKKNHEYASTVTTHFLFLSLILSLIVMVLGLFFSTPIFTLLGARGEILSLTEDYMRIWFLGSFCSFVTMGAYSIMMSAGDSKSSSILMVAGTIFNTILDPIFIFGFAGIPAMGIKGAAWATVLSQTVPLFWGLYVLTKKLDLIQYSCLIHLKKIWISWKRIFYFAIPNVLSNLLQPLSLAVITRLIASHGQAAIAATGAAGRLEMFAFMIPMTVGMTLVPFIGQNFGANRYDRIKEGAKLTFSFAVLYGFFITTVFYLSADYLASFFTEDAEVKKVLVSYIQIISFGYGLMESHRYATFVFTGMQRPLISALLNIIRVIVLLLPLSLVGSHYFGITGIFGGRLITDVAAGLMGIVLTTLFIRKKDSGRPSSLNKSQLGSPYLTDE